MNIYSILIISAACLLTTNASKVSLKMGPKYSEKVKAAGEVCVKEFGAPPDFLQQLFPWNYPKNERNEHALYCFVTTLGLANQDGIFYADKVHPFFSTSDKFEEIKKAFADCEGIRGKSQQETAFIISECFFDKAPIRLMM